MFGYDAMGRLIQEYSTVVQTGSNAKTVYTTNDHLGSPRINTDGIGTVISRHDYHPFGEEIARTGYGSDTIRKQFTGYERDGETGLDFAQARYFNSDFGRFSTPDPLDASANAIRPQSWNRYSYVYNNPYRYNDPTGMISRLAVDPDQNENDPSLGDRKGTSTPPPTCPGGCRPSLDVGPPPVSNADAFYSSSTVYPSLGMTEPIPESVPTLDWSPRMIARYNLNLTMTLVNRETGTSRTDFSYEISYSGASPQNSQTGNRQRAPDNGIVDLGTFTVYSNQNQETLATGMPPLPDGTNRTFSGTVTIFGSNGERVATTSFEATVTKAPGSYPQVEIGETRREVFTTPRQVWERQPSSNP